MFKKLFIFSLTIVCVVVFMNMTINQNHDKRIRSSFNHRIDEDVVGGEPRLPRYQGPPIQYDMSSTPEVYSDAVITITNTEVDPAGRTYYDLQSNACIKYIWQDPARFGNLHACFMVDPVGGSGFPDRRTKYFFSDDTGHTWSYLGNVPDLRSGFPGISGLKGGSLDGVPIIMNHSVEGGGLIRGQSYNDISIGAGSFSHCDPGTPAGDNKIWPHFVPTQNSGAAGNKVVFVTSINATAPNDSVFLNRQTGLGGSCSFSGYSWQPLWDNADQYNLARGDDGRIGVAYSSHDPVEGMVYFQESTDNGVTFSPRTTVWTANYGTDSMGVLRSVDITYLVNSPKVVFGTVMQDNAGGYFVNGPTKIYSWSPGINGGNPVKIDSGASNGSNPFNSQAVMVGVTRAVIGKSSDNNAIYVAYNKARTDTNALGDNYFDVYFTYSSTGGATWSPRTRVTNNSGPLRDCQYVAISSGVNHVAGYHFAHLIFQQDSVPGSYVNGAGQSLARMMYSRVSIDDPIGIHNINGQVPKDYVLHQNYPNPFNPSTRIKFELPENSFVTMKVYNAIGEQVAVLINENLSAGVKEYEYDASNLPSGIYFYTIKAGNFTDTKKMVLLK